MSIGRLTVRTPKKRRQFLSVLAGGYSVTRAAQAIGISRVTAYAWRREDPDFAAAWDEAWESGTDCFEDALREMAAEKNIAAVIFGLKSRRPERYNRAPYVPEDIPMVPITGGGMQEATGRQIYLPGSDIDQGPLIEGSAVEQEDKAA
jgi:transposase-like protein